MEDIYNIRQLNQFNYDDYDGIINFVNTRQVPDHIQNKAKFRKQFRNFDYNEDEEHLYYTPLNAIVARNIEDREYMLSLIYEKYPGHGIGQFYEIVSHSVINITKAYATTFLKRQVNYQLAVLPKKQKVRAKVYKNPDKAWAIDLIDMSNNQDGDSKYILTVIDLYNAKVYLRTIEHKTKEAVGEVLRPIFEVVAPRIIIADNGGEFSLQPLFREFNIKFINTPSHTPQPHVENANGQVRKMLRARWIRDQNTNWVDNLIDVEEDLNNYNLTIKKKKPIPDPTPYQPKYPIDSYVRISLTLFYPKIREMNKANLSKHIPVKWSIHVFKIYKHFKSNDANSLVYYGLKDGNGDIVENTHNDNASRFKESDLLQVSQHNDGDDNIMTIPTAEHLNSYLQRAKVRRELALLGL